MRDPDQGLADGAVRWRRPGFAGVRGMAWPQARCRQYRATSATQWRSRGASRGWCSASRPPKRRGSPRFSTRTPTPGWLPPISPGVRADTARYRLGRAWTAAPSSATLVHQALGVELAVRGSRPGDPARLPSAPSDQPGDSVQRPGVPAEPGDSMQLSDSVQLSGPVEQPAGPAEQPNVAHQLAAGQPVGLPAAEPAAWAEAMFRRSWPARPPGLPAAWSSGLAEQFGLPTRQPGYQVGCPATGRPAFGRRLVVKQAVSSRFPAVPTADSAAPPLARSLRPPSSPRLPSLARSRRQRQPTTTSTTAGPRS